MPYRDLLVQQIIAAGQTLIDNAESLIPEGLSAITDYYIHLAFPQNTDELRFPSITLEATAINELAVKQIFNNSIKGEKTK